METARKFIDEQINRHKVAVFSKSYCPYCAMAKKALNDVKTNYHLIELNQGNYEVNAFQDLLLEMTGGRTVFLFILWSYIHF